MDPQNTGSFGSAIGGSPELLAAMQRRGIDASALQQVSPASAGGVSPVPVTPDPTAATAALGQELPQPAQPTPPDSDNTIAMKALATVVTNDSKMKRDLVNMRSPQGAV